jgi:hypothetical protein
MHSFRSRSVRAQLRIVARQMSAQAAEQRAAEQRAGEVSSGYDFFQ